MRWKRKKKRIAFLSLSPSFSLLTAVAIYNPHSPEKTMSPCHYTHDVAERGRDNWGNEKTKISLKRIKFLFLRWRHSRSIKCSWIIIIIMSAVISCPAVPFLFRSMEKSQSNREHMARRFFFFLLLPPTVKRHQTSKVYPQRRVGLTSRLSRKEAASK